MIIRVLSRLALTVVYFVVVMPLALFRRFASGDPMTHEPGDMGYWQPRAPATNDAAGMKRPS